MPHSSPTVEQINRWNNPASIGFLIWKRHTSSAAAGLPLLLKKQETRQSICRRNMSVDTGSIARQINRTGIGTVRPVFLFGFGRNRALEHTPIASRDSGLTGYGPLNESSRDKGGPHPVL